MLQSIIRLFFPSLSQPVAEQPNATPPRIVEKTAPKKAVAKKRGRGRPKKQHSPLDA